MAKLKMAILLIVLIITPLFIYEFLRLKKLNKKDRNSFVYLMIFAFGLSLMKGMEISIPNPLTFIALIFGPVSDWLLTIFK